jgi:hypothetical protein
MWVWRNKQIDNVLQPCPPRTRPPEALVNPKSILEDVEMGRRRLRLVEDVLRSLLGLGG